MALHLLQQWCRYVTGIESSFHIHREIRGKTRLLLRLLWFILTKEKLWIFTRFRNFVSNRWSHLFCVLRVLTRIILNSLHARLQWENTCKSKRAFAQKVDGIITILLSLACVWSWRKLLRCFNKMSHILNDMNDRFRTAWLYRALWRCAVCQFEWRHGYISHKSMNVQTPCARFYANAKSPRRFMLREHNQHVNHNCSKPVRRSDTILQLLKRLLYHLAFMWEDSVLWKNPVAK